MVTVTEFCRAVIPHGTTSMFIDPHEIANVLGLEGVRLMHDEALEQPVNVWVQMPSCVPSAPGLEEGGARLGPKDVAEAMGWPAIIGLGEVMNFPGVAGNDATMVGEIAATRSAGKTVGGHFASPDLGRAFHGYVAGGPEDDHEGTRMEDAAARVRQGMKAMLRLGSAWYDVAEQVRAITEMGLDFAALHPVHRRLPFRHAGSRRAHGPRRAPRHLARPEADDRDPDGDDQHRRALQAGARDRLGHAGPARGLPDRLRPRATCRSTPSMAAASASRPTGGWKPTCPPTPIRPRRRTR